MPHPGDAAAAAGYFGDLQPQPPRRDMGRIWDVSQLVPQPWHRRAPERKPRTVVAPVPQRAHFKGSTKPARAAPQRPASAGSAASKDWNPAEKKHFMDFAAGTVENSGDPMVDLQKRLKRLDRLWEVQRGREQLGSDITADLRGPPRLYEGWSSVLARDTATKQLEAAAQRKKASQPKPVEPSTLRGMAAPAAAPPPPPSPTPKRTTAQITVLEKARWARAEEQLNEYMRARGRPPRRGPANDGDPRGHEVRSWPLAAALDALPSDAMRHKDFRTTILQSKLYEAKFHKAAAAAAATNDSTKPARRGAWD